MNLPDEPQSLQTCQKPRSVIPMNIASNSNLNKRSWSNLNRLHLVVDYTIQTAASHSKPFRYMNQLKDYPGSFFT